MSVTPSVFPTYSNEQSSNSAFVFALSVNKDALCNGEQCFDRYFYSTNRINVSKITKRFTVNKSMNYSGSFIFKDYFSKLSAIKIVVLYSKFKTKNINIFKTTNIPKTKEVKFEIKIKKINNIKKINIDKTVYLKNVKLNIIKQKKASNNFTFITSPFNIRNLYSYITKESPYRLIIKFKRMNKVIYPKTTIPYHGKITKRI